MKWIIDCGHGGVAFGVYLTTGKQSPEVPPGVYEGEYNRLIGTELASALRASGIDACCINSGPVNARETEKADAANRIAKVHGDCVYLALHCNASPSKGWSSANGTACFHVPKRILQSGFVSRKDYATEKKLATRFVNNFSMSNDLENRGVKEANFYILRAVKMPAVLLEMFFMTCKEETEDMARNWMRAVASLAATIIEIEDEPKI